MLVHLAAFVILSWLPYRNVVATRRTVVIVCIRCVAPGERWRARYCGSSRRFVDRKMIVSRGLSACKRASRSGSWICGIDGPSRRPAGRLAEFAGTNRQRIDNLIRHNDVAALDLSPKSIGISIYLSHSLIPSC